MRKIVLFFFILAQLAVLASRPIYLNERWDIGGLPRNNKALDSITRSQWLELNNEEIQKLIQIENFTAMGLQPFLQSYDVKVYLVGNFKNGGNQYVIYDIYFGYHDRVRMLACVNKKDSYPKTLIIGSGCGYPSRYVDYEYLPKDNILRITRIYRWPEALVYSVNEYRLDKNLSHISEHVFRRWDNGTSKDEEPYSIEKISEYGEFEQIK